MEDRGRQLRQHARLLEIDRVADEELALVTVHHHVFPSAKRPDPKPLQPVDESQFRGDLESAAGIPSLCAELGGGIERPLAVSPAPANRAQIFARRKRDATIAIPLIRRGERRRAVQIAGEQTDREVADLDTQTADQTKTEQARLDSLWIQLELARADVTRRLSSAMAEEHTRRVLAFEAETVEIDDRWSRLLGNNKETVLAMLEAAFEDNEAPAAPIDSDGTQASVVMIFGGLEMIPEQQPALTPTGKRTLKKRTKTERNELYLGAMGSNVLALVRETLAVAPGIDEVAVIVVRQGDDDALGAIYAGQFSRQDLAAREWDRLDPGEEIQLAEGALLCRKGRAGDIAVLDLGKHSDLARVLSQLASDLELAVA